MLDKFLLFPYYAFLKIRNGLYDSGKLNSARAQVPAICIGGLAAGGTGKTPCTEYVLSILLESEEWKDKNIAVLSRGYKRKSKGFKLVSEENNALFCGDEPLQMKNKFPQVTVAVCENRVKGCEMLCHPVEDYAAADIIVLDDAYQARELRAHKNIVLTDYNRPILKDRLLPIGTLRDLPRRLYDADIVVVTKCPESITDEEKKAYVLSMGYLFYDADSCIARTRDGREQKLFFSYIEYLPCAPIDETTNVRYLYSKKIIMLTGIAIDTPLFRKLSGDYRIVKRMSLSDHHNFSKTDIKKLVEAVKRNPSVAIVTTEKDRQRLIDCPYLDRNLLQRTFIAPIRMKIHGEEQSIIFEREVVSFE